MQGAYLERSSVDCWLYPFCPTALRGSRPKLLKDLGRCTVPLRVQSGDGTGTCQGVQVARDLEVAFGVARLVFSKGVDVEPEFSG